MAMIVDAFAGKLVKKLGNVIEEKAIMVLGVKDELQKLQRRMKRIECVLKDAERRRIQQEEAVKLWVEELKDVMYDAEDIIDLCMIQGTGLLLQDDHHPTQLAESSAAAETRLAESSATAFKRVRHSLSSFSTIVRGVFSSTVRSVFSSTVRSVPFRYEIADKIKNLNAKLEEISADKDKFNFIISSKSSDDAYVMNEASYRQSSFLPESDIVGWDIIDATNSLVELLVSQHQQKCRLFAIVGMGGIGKTTLAQLIYNDSKIKDSDIVGWDIRDATNSLVELLVSQHQQKCRLFAIVGMGGIGKTTLAQLIYTDSKIKDDFVLHAWICVSKVYTSKTDLLKELIRNVKGTYGEATTIAELQKILCDVLHGKSLFLVLDDVWNADVWIDLIKNPVERTTTKCSVLVTTRDRNIAIKMGAIHIHNVNKLPLNFGWELLCKKVFTNNDQSEIQRMKHIGMQIVEKCDGLPVAIKAIAGVLITTEQNKREWENILNSNVWTITGLPEELRGALYLSYEALPSALKHCFLYCSLNPLDRDLFKMDLVCEWIAEGFIEPNGDASMEDVAEGYYMDLIRRSFLQPNPNYADMYKCTMHDLLRALAIFLIGDESFSGDPQASQSNSSMIKLRRLAISSNRESVSTPHLDCLRNLRLWTSPSMETQMIGSFKQLRILLLNGDGIENIPDNIGDLVHLRLLDLKNTRICRLPDSLGNLINLQFLLLSDCEALHILPRSITRLCNLRRLNLENTPVNFVPKGIGKLEHLNYLSGFIINDAGGDNGEGCNMEDLQMLKNLRHLQIGELEKASKSTAVLLNKPRLKLVGLGCTPDGGGCNQQEMDRIVQVFDELCPPPCLDNLQIIGFFGEKYPQWMSSNSISTALPELTSLHLIYCSNCPQLPQLGQLPQLKYLYIHGATSVISIDCEFLGNGKLAASAFPKLEHLLFLDMPNWEQWSLVSGEEDQEIESSKLIHFPRLQEISIGGCPKLKALPRGLNHVQTLYIWEAHSISRISDLPALRKLFVKNCPMLDCVEKLESLQSLKIIVEGDDSLPKWLVSFLQQCESHHNNRFHLHLECSAQALKGCLKGRPYWGFLQQVPRLEAYAENGSMYLKYTKEPFSYQTNLDEGTTNED